MSNLTCDTAKACQTAITRQSSPLRDRLFLAFSLTRQRRQLGRLDAALLADIGVKTPAAHAEARRPFWDVPSNWRR